MMTMTIAMMDDDNNDDNNDDYDADKGRDNNNSDPLLRSLKLMYS